MIVKEKTMNNPVYKTSSLTQKIEVPADQIQKERMMRYHGVTNDHDLKLAIYREMLKNKRNERS